MESEVAVKLRCWVAIAGALALTYVVTPWRCCAAEMDDHNNGGIIGWDVYARRMVGIHSLAMVMKAIDEELVVNRKDVIGAMGDIFGRPQGVMEFDRQRLARQFVDYLTARFRLYSKDNPFIKIIWSISVNEGTVTNAERERMTEGAGMLLARIYLLWTEGKLGTESNALLQVRVNDVVVNGL